MEVLDTAEGAGVLQAAVIAGNIFVLIKKKAHRPETVGFFSAPINTSSSANRVYEDLPELSDSLHPGLAQEVPIRERVFAFSYGYLLQEECVGIGVLSWKSESW